MRRINYLSSVHNPASIARHKECRSEPAFEIASSPTAPRNEGCALCTPLNYLTRCIVVSCAFSLILVLGVAVAEEPEVAQGTLRAISEKGEVKGEFPLKHTDVDIEVCGYVASVVVKQEFHNPYEEKIEAVYVFPLPQTAAVDDMTIKVGERTIRGLIKNRQEARKIYEDAKRQGYITGLLEQERPNIFTQSVANIVPGDAIEVTIHYVQILKYEEGIYELSFPMVVGPRFVPGAPIDTPSAGGWAPNTVQVPDASRITPPVLKPDERSGHDIDVHVTVKAGVPVHDVTSKSHRIDVARIDETHFEVALHPQDRIPNKDFVLKYGVLGEAPQTALIAHRSETGGYFTLIVYPKEKIKKEEVTPREMVFVIDCSGSMMGKKIEKAKEAIRRALQGMNPKDTFQIIRFSEKASQFSPGPMPNTPENVRKAIGYLNSLEGQGGTMMIEGIKAALDYPRDPERMRIVFFMTDGYIGNETQILAAIEDKIGDARLFSFGVDTSPNRYLLDRMAEVGRGFVQYVRPDEDTEEVVRRFYNRISTPYLTDIHIDWSGLKVSDIYPKRIPDLFAGQTIILNGRYDEPGEATISIKGKVAGEDVEYKVKANLPGKEEENAAMASLWARAKIKELMSQQYIGEKPEIVEEVTNLALKFRLLSKYTAFVAVEETYKTEGEGPPRKVLVPVPLPEYVEYEGMFGKREIALNGCFKYFSDSDRHAKMSTYNFVDAAARTLKESAEIPQRTSIEISQRPTIKPLGIKGFGIGLKKEGWEYWLVLDSNGRLWKYKVSDPSKSKRLLRRLSKRQMEKFRLLLDRIELTKLHKGRFGSLGYGNEVIKIEVGKGEIAEVTISDKSAGKAPIELEELRDLIHRFCKI